MSALEFKVELKLDGQQAESIVQQVVQKTGLDVLTGVVIGTPVDTGRARGAWEVRIGRPTAAIAPGLPSAGKRGSRASDERKAFSANAAIARGSPTIAAAAVGPSINISNNVEYIEVLNRGRHTGVARYERNGRAYTVRREQGSIQAPAGIVLSVLARYGQTTPGDV